MNLLKNKGGIIMDEGIFSFNWLHIILMLMLNLPDILRGNHTNIAILIIFIWYLVSMTMIYIGQKEYTKVLEEEIKRLEEELIDEE
jgi:hypothetical protein